MLSFSCNFPIRYIHEENDTHYKIIGVDSFSGNDGKFCLAWEVFDQKIFSAN